MVIKIEENDLVALILVKTAESQKEENWDWGHCGVEYLKDH